MTTSIAIILGFASPRGGDNNLHMLNQTRALILASYSEFAPQAMADTENFQAKLVQEAGRPCVHLRGGVTVMFENLKGDVTAFRIDQRKGLEPVPAISDEVLRSSAERVVKALHGSSGAQILGFNRDARGCTIAATPTFFGRASTQNSTIHFDPGSPNPSAVYSFFQLSYGTHAGANIVSEELARSRAIDAYLRGRPFASGRISTSCLRVGLPGLQGGSTLSEMLASDLNCIAQRVAVPFYQFCFIEAQAQTFRESDYTQMVAVDARSGRPLLMAEVYTLGKSTSRTGTIANCPKVIRGRLWKGKIEGGLTRVNSELLGASSEFRLISGNSFFAGKYYKKSGLVSILFGSKLAIFKPDAMLGKALLTSSRKKFIPFGTKSTLLGK